MIDDRSDYQRRVLGALRRHGPQYLHELARLLEPCQRYPGAYAQKQLERALTTLLRRGLLRCRWELAAGVEVTA